MLARFAVVAAVAFATPAWAGPLAISSSSASSYYTESGNYSPERSVDGKQTTAWVEGDVGSGLGAHVELELASETLVKQVRLWGGDWSSWDAWHRANRPKDLELKFSDGSTQMVTLADEKVAQTFAIDGGGKKTTSVRVRIKSTYAGTTWPDTGISEIQLFGEEEGAKVSASSEAPEDGDGNYQSGNAYDGLFDSMWCEGDKDGDGTGQWLKVDFGKARTISKISLVNGIGSSMSLWMKANQATSLRLVYSDGSSHTLEIERPSFRPTEYGIPTVTTSSVKIEIIGVKQGKEFNDLCISEVGFSG